MRREPSLRTGMQLFDIIVVGGGVMGCAAASSLAREGHRVLLLERHSIGNGLGSSHGQARIIRLAYSTAGYIALCRAAYPAWRSLEAETDTSLIHPTGGLDFGRPERASWSYTRSALAEARVPVEELDGAEIRRRFPQFNLPENIVALYQPDAGVLHADRCIAALADTARRAGAEIHEGEQVLGIRPTPTGAEIETTAARYGADGVVLALGAWTRRILVPLGLDLPLTVSKEQIGFFAPRHPALFGPELFPLFILHLGNGCLGSGFPLIRDKGIKLMLEHKQGSSEEADEDIDLPRLHALASYATRLLPDLSGEALHAETCRYTLTPDEDFILDRHPLYPQIVVAVPCSGHGFKFAALFGAAIADLCFGRPPKIDITPFRLGRAALKPKPSDGRDAIQAEYLSGRTS
jgi:sarcosine oxidase